MNGVSDADIELWISGMKRGNAADRDRVFAYADWRCGELAPRFKARYPIIKSYELTLDVRQQTLARLFEKEKQDRFPSDAAGLRALVVGTLLDICIELSRKYLGPYAPVKAHDDSRLPEPSEVGTSVSQWLIREERHSLVLSAVKGLPDGQREAIRLRYSEEMTYPEIGEALGVDPKTAERWLNKALVVLSERLGRD
jgi:RNA polymerase sigma factor (sigma-70 family)